MLRTAAVLALFTAARAASAQTGLWYMNGPQGGSVYCVVADPSNPSTLYAGTRRGVFKSADAGATWQATGAGLPPVHVQTIAIDPSSPSTLYAGTLTPNGVESVGIFKSVDSGATWTAINNGLIDTTTGVAPVDVEALALVPGSPGTLLAGTRFSDIFKSTDGGQSWQAVTSGGYNYSFEVPAFQFLPSNPATVYAASSQGFLRSTDGGNTWSYYGNLGVSLSSLVINPASPTTFYAGANSGDGIYKSTDGGSHFSQINKNLPVPSGSSAPVILALALDPSNPGILYAGTYGNGLFKSTDGATWAAAATGMRDLYVSAFGFSQGPTLFAGTLAGGIYRSTDGAQSWAMTSSGINLSSIYDLAADPATAGQLYAATFDGLKTSSDGGATWQSGDSGLPLFVVVGLALVPASPGTLFAATLGGGLFESMDGASTWTAVKGLMEQYVSSICVDPNNSSTLYAGSAHPDTSHPERVFKSTDGGKTWAQTGLNGQSLSIDYLAVNPVNASQVIAGSSNTVGYFQSLDAGKTWSNVTTDTTCGGVNGVLFDHSGSTVYLAGGGGVCRSTDGGKTWTLSTLGYLSAVQSLLWDPTNPSTLYAAASPSVASGTGGVFRSTDAGQTWQPFGAGLPSDAAASRLAADLRAGRSLYAGTQGLGVASIVLSSDRAAVKAPPAARKTGLLRPR